MEAEATSASQCGRTYSPESLRQRQRDRLSPRGRTIKGRETFDVRERELGTLRKKGTTLSPTQKSRLAASPLSDAGHIKPGQQRKTEEKDGSPRRELEAMKPELAPDGSSAGREGRQFTVAKVGNNGRIYLRPTIRPAIERFAQPSFVFPITPPSTAGLDALTSRNQDENASRNSLWTPIQSPSTMDSNSSSLQSPLPRPILPHQRSYSFSTIDEHNLSIPDQPHGGIKVVIERPRERPKPPLFEGLPILEVPIPSYKLGVPRFSARGTAFLRGSTFTSRTTTSEDVRPCPLINDRSSKDLSLHRFTQTLSRRHSDASPQPYDPIVVPHNVYDAGCLRSPGIARRPMQITPEMFDALTFKPSCDHPSVVRYSMNGSIKGATPARLVAEITSPTFVDYDLLSDFFLTFRSFLEPMDLLYMLIARLTWAIARADETGTVVRVRTFVAIRHWILNYFLDDFVMDYELRRSFCHLLNNFTTEQSENPPSAKSPVKILAELKKCWRRVCALYWDGPEFDTELGVTDPITPGGVAGSRDPTLDPSFWATHPHGPPKLEGIIEPDFIDPGTESGGRNFFADVSRAGHLDSIVIPNHNTSELVDEPPQSPTSIISEDFVSCSFPSKHRRPGTAQPLGAHPVPASSVYDTQHPVMATPKALTGKRVRPNHGHRRSASFSDSYRDRRVPHQPVQKVIYKSTELLLAFPYAGSLVRGNLIPPGQPYVHMIAPGTPAEDHRAATSYLAISDQPKGPSAMSGPGMKKLLGSVRRALSSRTGPSPNASPTQGSFPHIPPLGVRGATVNRLPGTAIVPQARPRNASLGTPMRIDLLGAEIAEDFKKAVKEDADADAEDKRIASRESPQNIEQNGAFQYSDLPPIAPQEQPAGTGIASNGMTTASQSILIVDDTSTLELPPLMTSARQNPSVDTFADVFIQPSGGPTPPSTPPQAPSGTPRRSSHLLGGHVRSQSSVYEPTPSLVVDSRPFKDDEQSPSHRPQGRWAILPARGDSFRLKKSLSLRRRASHHSVFTHDIDERSFDATTHSEVDDVAGTSHVPSVPAPLRLLRRRPGGDLRAVNNVEDLNTHSLRRPMSTGSLTTYSESIRSSYLLNQDASEHFVEVVSSEYDQSQRLNQTFSVGQLAEPLPKTRVSYFSAHSSQPDLRPSFEKEAQILAQIPDDVDDDGGVESALLKLEGKFEKRHSDISERGENKIVPELHNSFGLSPYGGPIVSKDGEEQEKRRHRQKHIVEPRLSDTPPLIVAYQPKALQSIEALKPTVYRPRGYQPRSPALMQSPKSMESYNSTPLLERGLTDDEHEQRRNWSDQSILRGLSAERRQHELLQTPESSHVNSYDFIEEADNIEQMATKKNRHPKPSPGVSFLDSGSDGDSDISSELSMEVITKTELTGNDMATQISPTTLSPSVFSAPILREKVSNESQNPHPQSPQLTLLQALKLSSASPHTRQVAELRNDYETRALPPTPQITPTALHSVSMSVTREGAALPTDPLRSNGLPEASLIPEASRKTSVHLPFILAFDSQILAQQFTLIEKDALNEVDWKDLIEMRWKDSSTESRSWVTFLRDQEPHGVEVVIARFNIMVKWAVSECMLTQDLGERIRCIIKYIHIAAHCRKYRNFATMTQITVALTSKDVSRLTKTWAHVPAADIQTLREMEALVTPTHNFHSLRAEMEGSGTHQGCIPFIGIYTHDLLINVERPSQIASTPTTEPLVNFERCRTDATIVKNLLRLLEASQLYRFLPIEGITERCLWMAALSDEEIAKYGKMIQD